MAQSIFPVGETDGDGQQDPEVVAFEDADTIIEALASGTARTIVDCLTTDPMTPSQLADRADTSIQNVTYHLERLTDAGLVEVVDTCYSSRGTEMNVYAPVADPLVICLGADDSDQVSRAVESADTAPVARSD